MPMQAPRMSPPNHAGTLVATTIARTANAATPSGPMRRTHQGIGSRPRHERVRASVHMNHA